VIDVDKGASSKVILPQDLVGLKVVDKAISEPRVEGIKEVIVSGMAKDASMYTLSREIMQASDWDGDLESKLCVIKCLTASLNLNEGVSKKRKI
jgi:hypothetical protein